MQQFNLPVRKFIEQRMAENYPDFDFRRSTALNDMTANTFAALIQPFRNEIDAVKIAQSIKNYDFITEDQMNDLLFNLLIYRNTGSKAFGKVRMSFSALNDYNYSSITFLTSDGLKFVNSFPINITPVLLSGNIDQDGTFYFDVDCESVDTGSQYAVDAGAIVSVDGNFPEIARVTNVNAFTQSSSKETNFQAFQRAQDATITRTLINEYSIRTVLFNEFPFLRDIKVVGAGDPAMIRDIVNINNIDIHTYGKTDIYVDTGTTTEYSVDLSYIPENAKIDLVDVSKTEPVFPEDVETSSTGNSRKLYVQDGLHQFTSGNDYFNNIFRVYYTAFGADIYKDYIVKSQTIAGELVVVDQKLSEGSYLIPYQSGYINLDGFASNYNDDYIFKGQNGQGSDYLKVDLTGHNFITAIQDATYSMNNNDLFTVTGTGSIDSAFITGPFPAITVSLTNPKLVITTGDAVGGYPVVSLSSGGFWIVGNQKQIGTTFDTYSAATVISLTVNLDRSITAGDYVRIYNYSNDQDLITTVTQADSVSMTVAEPITAGISTISIHDGLLDDFVAGDLAFIAYEDAYDVDTAWTTLSYTRTVYNDFTLITTAGMGSWDMEAGDAIEVTDSLIGINHRDKYPIITKTSVTGQIGVLGVFPVGPKYLRLLKPKSRQASPVLPGLFNYWAAGSIQDDVTVSGAQFLCPGIAVNSSILSPPGGPARLVNFNTFEVYNLDTTIHTGLGMNGINLTTTPTFTAGDQWCVFPRSTDIQGGSCWNDIFSWYGQSFDSTLLTTIYPLVNPNIQLVIAGGPNQGTYDVLSVLNSVSVQISTTLDNVATTSASGTFFGTYLSGSTTLGLETVSGSGTFPTAVAGDTLFIKTGIAAGYYRVSSVLPSHTGVVVSSPLTGNVFGLTDQFDILKDRFQPFFFIQNETRFKSQPNVNYEVWSPIDTIKRVTEGNGADTNVPESLYDANVSFDLLFSSLSGIPLLGSTVSFVAGANINTNVEALYVGSAHSISLATTIAPGTNNKYEIYHEMLNNNQITYNVLENYAYYNDTFFVLPVLYIKEIVEIDPFTNEVLTDPLIPDVDYKLFARTSSDKSIRYTANEKLIIKFDPFWIFKAVKITYVADPLLTVVDQLVKSDVMRITNNDIMVKRMESTVVDITCEVSGIDATTAAEIINQYISTLNSTSSLKASDIISLLYQNGATYVNTERFTIQGFYLPPVSQEDVHMWTVFIGSRNEISTPKQASYIPGNITVTVI